MGEGESKLPCWNGLCPGQSIEASKLDSQLRSINGIEWTEVDNNHHEMYFRWVDTARCNKSVFCRVSGTIDISGDKIQSITLKPDYSINIGDFIYNYGEPECVDVIGDATSLGFFLSGSSKGVSLSLVVQLAPISANISKNMLINNVILYEPHDSKGVCGSPSVGRGYRWQGLDAAYP